MHLELGLIRTMQNAKNFVFPCRYVGFPNAHCEDMANGMTVIASDCNSGPGEIVTDGVNGILFPPENSDALTSVMIRW